MVDSEGTTYRFALAEVTPNGTPNKYYLTDLTDSSSNWVHITYRPLTLTSASPCTTDNQSGCETSGLLGPGRTPVPLAPSRIAWNPLNHTAPNYNQVDLAACGFARFTPELRHHGA